MRRVRGRHCDDRPYGRARRDDHKGFYCINGHCRAWQGKTEAEKLRERLTAKERELAAEVLARMNRDKTIVALKGQVTRTKNRVAAGMCPCCNRSFVALGRHMATKHPDWKTQDIG